jgi:hypothetical protein
MRPMFEEEEEVSVEVSEDDGIGPNVDIWVNCEGDGKVNDDEIPNKSVKIAEL